MESKPPEIHLDPEVEELWSSRALLLVLVLLILSFWVSYYLKIKRIKTIHETLVALFAGMVIGLIVRLSPGEVVQNMISFKSTIMLNVLLPPIILASGYDLKEENFFRNFGVILTFAFCGTFISAVVIGTLVYIWALLGFEGLSLGIIECLLFGSTLSATDPVTVLAIFNTLKVDPKLYSIIFGESLLNDAIAIVMFETLAHFHGEKISILSFFHGVGIFLLVFLTSMALGVVFGLACSLMLKHSRVCRFPEIESCLVLLIAYTSYFFSNASTMSGIVSLLFCGITLKHYAYHNMSRRTQRTTKYMFTTLSSLCENFIFIYLGLSLFTQTQLVYKPVFILVSALAVCVARYCAVFPISQLINVLFRQARGVRTDELPHSYQVMLFWAGLRGAVGVALAAGIKGDNAIALRTTVLVTVVLTMVIFGGTTTRMIEIVGIRTGVEEEVDSSDDEGLGTSDHGPAGFLSLARHGHHGGLYQDASSRKTSLGDALDLSSSKHLRGVNSGNTSDDPYKQFSRGSRDFMKRGTISSPLSERSMATQDSDDEVLPSTDPQSSQYFAEDGEARPGNEQDGSNRKVWRDGQWFTVLDEQYFLPVFSNATASRKQASRKALRNQKASLTGDLNYRPQTDLDGIPSPHSAQPSSSWNSDDGHTGAQGGKNPSRGGGQRSDNSRQTLRKISSPSTPTLFQRSFSATLSALVPNSLSSFQSAPSSTKTGPGNTGMSVLNSLKTSRSSQSLKKKVSDDHCRLADNYHKAPYSYPAKGNSEKIFSKDVPGGSMSGNNLNRCHQVGLSESPMSSSGGCNNMQPIASSSALGTSEAGSIECVASSVTSIQQTSNRIRSAGINNGNNHGNIQTCSSSRRSSCKFETEDRKPMMNDGNDVEKNNQNEDHKMIDDQLLSSHSHPSLSGLNQHSHVRCRSRDQIGGIANIHHDQSHRDENNS